MVKQNRYRQLHNVNPLGGYFELELREGREYHPHAIRLNTGTNAFKAILLTGKYQMIHLPKYNCDSLIQPLAELKIPYHFYPIDKNLEPVFDYGALKDKEGLLVVNYFGLKDNSIAALRRRARNLIVDNAQSFFSTPIEDTDTFYSPRKFFGVPDGAYLYLNTEAPLALETDHSFDRVEHLLRRIDISPEDGFSFYRHNEENLSAQPLRNMSSLTKALLKNIDYEHVRRIRIRNYQYYEQALEDRNLLKIPWDETQVPLVYPFLTDDKDLYTKLLNERIYTARYWPGVLKFAEHGSWEHHLANKLIALPIDQRLEQKDLERIVSIILKPNKGQ